MSEKAKPSPKITPGNELALGGLTTTSGMDLLSNTMRGVGERRVYYISGELTAARANLSTTLANYSLRSS
jgi:hypothetical protein